MKKAVSVLITVLLAAVLGVVVFRRPVSAPSDISAVMPAQESAEKSAPKELRIELDNIEASLTDGAVSLSDGRLVIGSAGSYSLSGRTDELSVLVSADGDVSLELDGVELRTDVFSAIASDGQGELKLIFTGEASYLESTADCAVSSAGKLEIRSDNASRLSGCGESVILSADDCTVVGQLSLSGQSSGLTAKKLSLSDASLEIGCSGKGVNVSSASLINSTLSVTSGGDCIEGKTVSIDSCTLELTSDGGMGIDASKLLGLTSSRLTVSSGDNGVKATERIEINSSVLTVSTPCNGIRSEQELYAISSELSIEAGFDGIKAGTLQSGTGIITLDGCKTLIDAYGKPIECGEALRINGGSLLGLGICESLEPLWSESSGLCRVLYSEGDEKQLAEISVNGIAAESHVSRFGFNTVVFCSGDYTSDARVSLRVKNS